MLVLSDGHSPNYYCQSNLVARPVADAKLKPEENTGGLIMHTSGATYVENIHMVYVAARNI